MRIDIITTANRDATPAVEFWRSWGWDPVLHDNTGQPLGMGRNRVIDEFNASGREWLCLADDDMVIDTTRGWGERFLRDPGTLLAQVRGEITSFGLMNNIHHRVDITLRNPVVENNWVFLRNYWIGCLMFHRPGPRPYYFHPTDVLEDMDWCLEQLKDRQRVAISMNLVQRNLGFRSTIFRDQEDRRERYRRAKQRIADTWPGVELRESGKLVKTRAIRLNWPSSPLWQSVPGIGPSLVVKPIDKDTGGV